MDIKYWQIDRLKIIIDWCYWKKISWVEEFYVNLLSMARLSKAIYRSQGKKLTNAKGAKFNNSYQFCFSRDSVYNPKPGLSFVDFKLKSFRTIVVHSPEQVYLQ